MEDDLGERRSPRTPAVWARAAIAGLAWLAGCVAPGADVHVAPLYTRLATAGGGTEEEALAGMWFRERAPGAARATVRGLRPLWSRREEPDGRVSTYFLAPLGFYSRKGIYSTSLFFPLFYWQAYPGVAGARQWDLIAFPLVLWSHRPHEDDSFGWFPFFGHARDFLTYDEVTFWLFPLYARTSRNGNVSYHVLWPVLGWTSGPTVENFHVWPFYGRQRFLGRYDRMYVLWPFYHLHRNHLGGGREVPETKWMLFPLFGKTKRASYRSYGVLWPFFGYAHDDRTGFWAVDAPWPLVRLQGGGENPLAEERTRVWPFYSHYRNRGLVAKSFLWPLGHYREEDYRHAERRSLYFIPFLKSWTRYDEDTGNTASYFHLWPVYEEHREGDTSRSAFPALNPLWRMPLITFHYGWLWEIFSVEENAWGSSQRSWGGLWRRETDRVEDRVSLSGIWSQRAYRDGEHQVTESSLLFGLLRWRKIRDGGIDLLPPALPGPGWPAREALEPIGGRHTRPQVQWGGPKRTPVHVPADEGEDAEPEARP